MIAFLLPLVPKYDTNNKCMKRIAIAFFALVVMCTIYAQQPPKREFRGTWIHTVGNSSYKNMTTEEMQQHYRNMLDTFEIAGINAVIYQIRPQADAFYISELEPWSRFLTGTQGQAPFPLWDPLEFMIEECHNRGMELHAWLNPYRVTSNDTENLCEEHLYYKKPYLFLKYGKQIYFDPGHPESREHTINVIADVVKRYDIDAIHFDDYFYPYKIKYEDFPDEESFMKYHEADGFGRYQKNDWRRNNVNMLVRDLNKTIKSIKPWVKFGISPFGIWRSKDLDPTGSNTVGATTNYDDLYADIKLWVEKGWIDYNVPQLYWEIGHPTADYIPLIEWWSENNFGAQLYIGQDIRRTINVKKNDGTVENQLYRKLKMVRENPDVHGNVWWSGYSLYRNSSGLVDSLKNDYQKYPALVPVFKHIDNTPPAPVRKLTGKNTPDGKLLTWEILPDSNEMDKAAYFCVYRFEQNEPVNIEDAAKLQKIVRKPVYIIPQSSDNKKYKYVVTALDRLYNESKVSKTVTL